MVDLSEETVLYVNQGIIIVERNDKWIALLRDDWTSKDLTDALIKTNMEIDSDHKQNDNGDEYIELRSKRDG